MESSSWYLMVAFALGAGAMVALWRLGARPRWIKVGPVETTLEYRDDKKMLDKEAQPAE